MKVLGVDWGSVRVGLALGSTEVGLADPVGDVQASLAENRIGKYWHDEGLDLIVVGVAEGKSADRAREFARSLSKKGFTVSLQDETLSTQEVQERMGKIKTEKRARIEHSLVAALILERWFEKQR